MSRFRNFAFWRRNRVQFLHDRRGNVMVLFALLTPVLVGGAGLGVETSYWYYAGLQLRTAADVSAYAAALEERSGSDLTKVETAAKIAAVDNGFDPSIGSVTVHVPPTSGAYMNQDAVEVILTSKAQRFFTSIFSDSDVNLSARSVASYATASNACVLALSPSASKAANFSGSSDLNLTGCSVMSNSVAADAVNVQGAAKLKTDCAISVGGIQATSGLTMTKCSSAIVKAPPVKDPFADVATPSVPSGGCKNAPKNPKAPYSLAAGYYCNGLSIDGDATLAAGVYYVDGDVNINANAKMAGSGVTIYVANSGRVTMNGSATIDLKAPTSGPYSGMLFFGNRNNTGGNGNKFNGTADSKMTGAIYFASQSVEYLGNFAGVNGCTQVVAQTVQWSGNTTMGIDCAAYGMNSIPAYTIVRLVE